MHIYTRVDHGVVPSWTNTGHKKAPTQDTMEYYVARTNDMFIVLRRVPTPQEVWQAFQEWAMEECETDLPPECITIDDDDIQNQDECDVDIEPECITIDDSDDEETEDDTISTSSSV